MENQQQNGSFEKFTWTIENFSKQNTKKLRSKAFNIRGWKWQILVHPLGKDAQHFSLCLKVADSLPPYGWSRNTYFKLALINQIDGNKSIVKETQQKFNGGHRKWGSVFLHLSDFYDLKQGYLLKNACIIEAYVCVTEVPLKIIQGNNFSQSIPPNHGSKNDHDQPEQTEMKAIQHQDHGTEYLSDNETLSSTTHDESSQTELATSEFTLSPDQQTYNSVPYAPPTYISSFNEAEEVPLNELIDLESLEQEDASFVPLLEEACSWHPSLTKSQKGKIPRSHIIRAFTTLGQVLYFLKTRKVKDMGENACKHLEGLWQELRCFGFDLAWLEPYVQSALGVSIYVEREEQVKKLKANVAALEIKMKKQREILAVAEVEIEVAKEELAEAEKGLNLKKMDMDAELGYAMF